MKDKLIALALFLPFILTAAALIGALFVPVREPERVTRLEIPPEILSPSPIQVHPELQKEMHSAEAEMLAKLVYSEARGVEATERASAKAQQAAVIWCALNRVDEGSWGDTVEAVVTCPGQFAWDPEAPVEDELLDLAEDVLMRWKEERGGTVNTGRVLPKRYLYFGAENGANYFRADYYSFEDVWQWKLPDPYTERSQ